MKTPINGITTGVQVLENYLNDDFFKKILKHLLNCCLELNMFVNDVIDFYLLKTKGIEYQVESTLLYPLIEELEDYFQEDFTNKNINFNKNISIFLQTPIQIDKKRLNQILRYIINNSIRFTKNGNIYLEIKYKDELGEYIEFTIKDEGCGISQEEKAKVFLPFYQVDCQNSLWMTTQEGLGLGLTNSKLFINQMQGDIYFLDNLEKGTTIQFYIKNQKDEFKKISKVQENLQNLENTNNLNNTKKILIIEDNLINGELIKLMIKNCYKNTNNKIVTDLIINPKNCINNLKSKNKYYDLILLDLKMPEISGFEILELIQQDKLLKEKYHKKIVIITALANNKEVSKLQNYNTVVDIIFKPIVIEKLKSVIDLIKIK